MMQKWMILPISVAMAVSLGSWATPGSAQTLDELKAQIQEMSKRLQELETKQDQLEKKTDETSVDSRTVISGKQGVRLTVSGQVNRGAECDTAGHIGDARISDHICARQVDLGGSVRSRIALSDPQPAEAATINIELELALREVVGPGGAVLVDPDRRCRVRLELDLDLGSNGYVIGQFSGADEAHPSR